MANIYKNIGVSWGTASTTSSTLGTFILTSRDHSLKADKEEIRDGNGNIQGLVFYNQSQEATFEYLPYSSTAGGAVSPTLPSIGTIVTVADTTAYTPIAATNWLVEDVSTKGSNTNALKVTLKLVQYAAITS